MMAENRVPAHDIEGSGPIVEPSLPSPSQLRRASTMLSQSSGRTQFSLSIKTMAHFTCNNCDTPHSGLQTLRFSRRNSFRNPLLCAKCNYPVVQFGGSPPTSRNQTFYQKPSSEHAESSSWTRKQVNTRRKDTRPTGGSGLAANARVASSVALPEAEGSNEDGIQEHDFQTIPEQGTLRYIDQDDDVNDQARSNAPTSNERRLGAQRKKNILTFRGGPIQKLLRRLRMKLFASSSRSSRFGAQMEDMQPPHSAQGKGKAPLHGANGPRIALPSSFDSPHLDARPSSSVPSQVPHHRCDCTKRCHCSEEYLSARHLHYVVDKDEEQERARITAHHFPGDPARSSDPSFSSPARRPVSTFNLSQFFFDFRPRRNRFSRERDRDSSVGYPSNLSSGDRSRSRPAQWPLGPQAPHPSAAGPSMATQGGGAGTQQEGSVHDSAIQMFSTPRPSQSDQDES